MKQKDFLHILLTQFITFPFYKKNLYLVTEIHSASDSVKPILFDNLLPLKYLSRSGIKKQMWSKYCEQSQDYFMHSNSEFFKIAIVFLALGLQMKETFMQFLCSSPDRVLLCIKYLALLKIFRHQNYLSVRVVPLA